MTRILEFTGNWFIDAGILGFVNLMEEVYGDVWKKEWKEKNTNEQDWKFNFLEYLNEKIKEDEEVVYYEYFPLAYLLYNAKIRFIFDKINKVKKEIFRNKGIMDKIKEEKKKLEDIENELKKLDEDDKEFKRLIKKKEKILQNIDKLENKLEHKNKKIIELKKEIKSEKERFYELFFKRNKDDDNNKEKIIKEFFSNFELKGPVIGRNFPLYNTKLKKDVIEALEYIHYLIKFDKTIRENNLEEYEAIFKEFDEFIREKIPKRKKEGLTIEIIPDSTINPFLYSEEKFSNIGYTTLLTTEQLIKKLRPSIPAYVAFLTFEHAFLPISGRNIMFYTNNLDICYSINKKVKIRLERLGEKKSSNIFRITWQSIIDEIIERESSFSLENLYIVELNFEQNKLSSVEYIGIPKLQAQVLLDDHIRNALNRWVTVHKAGKNTINKRILEEFISGKPLYPLVFQHIKTCLANNLNIDYFVFYSLLLDAAVLKFKEKQKEGKSKTLFSGEFLKGNYGEIVQEVKKEFSVVHYYTTQDIPKYLGNYDEKKRLAYSLLNALHSKDKAEFLYVLLKKLNKNKIINEPSLNWIYNKIINNNISWKEYGLLLTAGLVYKNE